MKIKIGILGYGNLGKGVECAIKQNGDMALAAIFTRRDPSEISPLTPGVLIRHASAAAEMKDEIDVMILCGGSAKDLPAQTPEFARQFNVVDSFDTHANIPAHLKNTDEAAKAGKKVAVISAGWDPGMFSVMRAYFGAFLPKGITSTFWGKGVSQGHSDAIRRIEGVLDAKQYTIPVDDALSIVRSGGGGDLTTRQKHTRECFVVLKEGADAKKVEEEIVSMPNYFADYDTTVHFITKEELDRDHSAMPHGGFVIRGGETGWEEKSKNVLEFSLRLDSNPEFTSSVLVAFARAAFLLSKEGEFGAKTIFDIPPRYFWMEEREELIKHML